MPVLFFSPEERFLISQTGDVYLVSKRIGSIDTLLLQMMDHFLLQKYFYATFMNVGINFGPENWRRKKRMKVLLP